MESLRGYLGTYRGFSPTDESAVGAGEIEVVIAEDVVTSRVATGLAIEETSVPISEMELLTGEAKEELFKEGSDSISSTNVFRGVRGSPTFIFCGDHTPSEVSLLILQGGMADIFGPSMLFDPKQVAMGEFDKAVARIEAAAGPNSIPKLSLGGRAK